MVVALVLSGCGNPEKSAMRKLEESQYAFEVEDFHVAAGAGDLESVLLFVEAGMAIDSEDEHGNTALIRAAANGRREMVEQLLGLGADPRRVNQFGRDALISSSAKGFEEVSRLLLGRGADPTQQDSEGWNALSIAAYNGHEGVVKLLTSEASQEMLDNALLVVSFNGNPAVTQHLLNQGAYINTRSPESQTPLMIASQNGHVEAVRVLLQNQANPYAVDDQERTAAMLAQAEGHGPIHDLIQEPGLWGESEESREVAEEMEGAMEALAEGGTVETLEESGGEPVSPVVAGLHEPGAPDASGEPLRSGEGTGPAPIDVAQAASPATVGPAEAPPARATPAIAVPAGADPNSRAVAMSSPEGTGDRVSPRDLPPVRSNARAREVRAEAKSKPMVAMNGSVIRSRNPERAAVESFVLAGYRERPVPIAVKSVEDGAAQVRPLDRSAAGPVEVRAGERIPGTPYEVREVRKKLVSSKEGKGEMVDVSRVEVEDTRTGARHLLVKDVAGQSSDSYAILTAPGSDFRYVVKTGDTFRTEQPGMGPRDYQVLDIRPHGVVVKDLTTEEVRMIDREGTIHR